MKLLLSAFSCGPGWGSEPGIGWNTVEQASRHHEVWVLTEAGWQERMGGKFDPARHPNVHFVWVRIPTLDKLVDGGPLNNGLGWLAYYYLWQLAALREARRLHAEHRFDLAHHVTFGKHSVPSHLHKLGIPFLFGPVGGAEKAPHGSFYAEFGWKTRLAESLRLLHVRLARSDPWLRACVKRAALSLGVTRESAEELRAIGSPNPDVLPAISLPDEEAQALAALPRHPSAGENEKLTLLFTGRLLAWKGIHLAIRALAQSDRSHLHLRVLGDGPERGYLEQLAKNLSVADRVQFSGSVPREEALRATTNAAGLLFPSLHDSGGYAVIEAMAAGLPVICLNLGGPGLFVNEDCGWVIEADTPDQTVEELAHALRAFADSPEERHKRGAAARERCLNTYTASVRGEQMERRYAQIALRH
ncbi:glycosyltransferase involved in cell wall biosynthesis [Roseimicrobium gellanilyticum]|uniref:Glycosyltransferase involved in cell wall biosynthesis n=1 Tax=Roseimicrobium gellanilyticum TaxID=748857 RepID=A0A366HT46_9BACT|nr:glycosyltransferase family 4 protein [Roseimicrobium gellanilyticum]RBP47442.1 glycosyltransferase involved in cell wall biosynthesis [Roseimicrobium gellanilyticum]